MAAWLGVVALAALIGLNARTSEVKLAAVDRVTLLPDDAGRVGKVMVRSAHAEQLLSTPYASAVISASGAMEVRTEEAVEVRRRYAHVLSAQPAGPLTYTVYFISGRDDLTAESIPVIETLKGELARRSAPELSVIGHTDRVGTVAANDVLSLRRAELLRLLLVQQGVLMASIEASGRGEREPLVPTADEVAEPRNRRVEINLR